MTPAPLVPPTTSPRADGAGRKPTVADLEAVVSDQAAQRHHRDQHRTDQQHGAGSNT